MGRGEFDGAFGKQVDIVIEGKSVFDWMDHDATIEEVDAFSVVGAALCTDATPCGPFFIYPTDLGSFPADAKLGVQIRTNTGSSNTYYFVEHRTSSTLGNKALITWSKVTSDGMTGIYGNSVLVDCTPETSSVVDAGCAPGTSIVLDVGPQDSPMPFTVEVGLVQENGTLPIYISANVPTSVPTMPPSSVDTVTVEVAMAVTADAPPTSSDLAALRTLLAQRMGVPEEDIRGLSVTVARRRLLAVTWAVSFTVAASLADVPAVSRAGFSTFVQDTLVAPSFSTAMAATVPGAMVDTGSIVLAEGTRNLPTFYPTHSPSLVPTPQPTHTAQVDTGLDGCCALKKDPSPRFCPYLLFQGPRFDVLRDLGACDASEPAETSDRRLNVLDQSCARATAHAAICNARNHPTASPSLTPAPSPMPSLTLLPTSLPTPVPSELACYEGCGQSCAAFREGSCADSCDSRFGSFARAVA